MDLLQEAEQWRQRARLQEYWEPAIDKIGRDLDLACRSVQGDFNSNNAVFTLDRRYIVKLYAPDQRASAGVEEEALRLLAANSGLSVPPLLGVGELAGPLACPYIVMGLIPGQPLDRLRGRLSAGERIDIAGQLGRAMALFHRTPISAQAPIRRAQGGWDSLCQARRRQLYADLDRLDGWPARLLTQLRAFAVSPQVDAYLREPQVLVHGDLTCYHVYARQRAGRWRIAGLIDLGNALMAPPEYEWVDLWLQTFERDVRAARAFFQAYQPGLVIDENYRRRLLAVFLHSWEAIPQLLAHLKAERAPVM